MDGQRFDELARSVAVGTSRRLVLRGLAAAAVAALLGGLGPDAAAAHDTLGRCRKIEDKRKRAACVKKAKRHNRQHATPPPPPPPPTGCTADVGCDDGDPCTEDVCIVETGECRHDAIPGCGGDVGDGCICSLKADGEACEADGECCTGYCGAGFGLGQSVCTYGERGCAGDGAFCANGADGGNACCTGVCEGCACTCLAPGAACATNASCCGICTADGCCLEVDSRCTGDADCCSGVCASAGYDDDGAPVSTCDRGPAGTACRGDGACQSLACCDGQCCADHPNGAYCRYDDALGRDVCATY